MTAGKLMSEDGPVGELQYMGFDAPDAASRAALLRFAARKLAQHSSHPPFGSWFVPGRVEVLGKHTDYAGGRSIVAAVPRGMAVVAAPRTDRLVHVFDGRNAGEVQLDPADRQLRGAGWTNYAAVVARRLAANFPNADLGADIAFASDLPRAAGMSSSSALVVGIGLALVARGGLEGRDEWRAAIGSRLDLAGYFGSIENGRMFRSLAGSAGVGTEGGNQDHTAILTCRQAHASLYRYLPVQRIRDEPMPDGWRFVLMTSGVHASKAGAQRARYNRAPQAVAALLDIWKRKAGDALVPSLAVALDRSPDAARQLHAWAGAGSRDFTGAELRRRLAHFVAEDARVPLAARAIADANADVLGELARESQLSAEADLGNQVDETVVLTRLARENGAFAASSFGAGFGGSVWALVEGDAAACAHAAMRWRDAYLAACPHVQAVEWFVTRPGPAAIRLVQNA